MFNEHKSVIYTLIVCSFIVGILGVAFGIEQNKRIHELEQLTGLVNVILPSHGQLEHNRLQGDQIESLRGNVSDLYGHVDALFGLVEGNQEFVGTAFDEISKLKRDVGGLRGFEQCVMQGHCPEIETQNWIYQCGVYSTTYQEYNYCVGLAMWTPVFRNEIIVDDYCTDPTARSSAEIVGLTNYKTCP
jgi:hypothetical protein